MFPDQIDWSDPVDIADWLLFLHRKLIGRYGHVDEHLLDGSIEDALLHYQNHPENFDASRGVPLPCYLVMRTRHYLDKKLRKVIRRREHERTAGVSDNYFEKIVSGLRVRRGIYVGRDGRAEEAEEREEAVERQRETLDAILAQLNPRDRAGGRLLRMEASRKRWVRHLGIEDLPHKEQQRRIDGEKDRLKKLLKRRVRKMQGGGLDPSTEHKFGQPVLS